MPKVSQTSSSSKSSPSSDSTFTWVVQQNQEKGGEKLFNLKGLNDMNQSKCTNSVGLNSSSFSTGEQQVNSSSLSSNNSAPLTSSASLNKSKFVSSENNSSFIQKTTDNKSEISLHSKFPLSSASQSYSNTIKSNASCSSLFSFRKEDPVNSTASSNPHISASPVGDSDSKNVSFNSNFTSPFSKEISHNNSAVSSNLPGTISPSQPVRSNSSLTVNINPDTYLSSFSNQINSTILSSPYVFTSSVAHASTETGSFSPTVAPFSTNKQVGQNTLSVQAPFVTFNSTQKITGKLLNTAHHLPPLLYGENSNIRNNLIVLNPSNNRHHSLSKQQQSDSSPRQRSNCLPTYTIDLSWTESVEIDDSAINRKVKKLEYIVDNNFETNYEIAWLLKAITCIDLTTLSGDDTMTNVHRLCYKAAHPVSEHLIKCFEEDNLFENIRKITTAAVCVYPARVTCAVNNMIKFKMNDEIPVASVATGFPSGQYPLESRLKEIEFSVANGAKEIDVVVNRNLVISNKWSELYDEITQMKIACGKAHMKTILATGECGSLNNIYKASMIAMMAGSDFIKTSTGKETVNATLQVGVVMCRAITDYYEKFNRKVGLKPAGGLKTANDALAWLVLVKELLGREWLNSHLFRIGASSLLGDIENRLFYLLKGYRPSKEYFLIS